MLKETNKNLIIKIILIFALISNNFDKKYIDISIYKEFIKSQTNTSLIKIFIITHKDFNNYRYNPIYNIVADDKSELENNYKLNIIYANESKLYNISRGYSEMSKIYYIYQLYKNETLNSKYVGVNHYRRYFIFGDNIPDIDEIFKNHDVILNKKNHLKRGMLKQYCINHICRDFVEILNIIKDIKPNYYKTAIKTSKQRSIHYCNLFIMKKEDFMKYCEFLFDVLFEFDKRNNFFTDNDMLNYSQRFYKYNNDTLYQSRVQAFLSERISNIYFNQHFKKIKTFKMITYY